MPSETHTTSIPPLSSLKVVVDSSMRPDEIRVHPAIFDLLRRAFLEADTWRGVREMSEP